MAGKIFEIGHSNHTLHVEHSVVGMLVLNAKILKHQTTWNNYLVAFCWKCWKLRHMQPLLQHDVAMLSLKKWDTACKSFKNFKPEKANFFFLQPLPR